MNATQSSESQAPFQQHPPPSPPAPQAADLRPRALYVELLHAVLRLSRRGRNATWDMGDTTWRVQESRWLEVMCISNQELVRVVDLTENICRGPSPIFGRSHG